MGQSPITTVKARQRRELDKLDNLTLSYPTVSDLRCDDVSTIHDEDDCDDVEDDGAVAVVVVAAPAEGISPWQVVVIVVVIVVIVVVIVVIVAKVVVTKVAYILDEF